MKWKDLSLKERKQIYDSVRVNNPDATYFDIKEQFDSIPTYEDGKGKTINKADLPPEYRTGTPEYFERQRKISGAVNYANRVNPVLRTLYDIRPDKQGFINRMNNLTPIEWAVPLGLPVFFGEEQENK